MFRRRQYEPVVIVTAVRWYLRFSLSLRNVEELMAERGLCVDHTTVWRWVQHMRRRSAGDFRGSSSTSSPRGSRHRGIGPRVSGFGAAAGCRSRVAPSVTNARRDQSAERAAPGVLELLNLPVEEFDK